ncbi:unnamed protein product, partial [Meganyctiphanes norvegica]
QIDFCVAQNSCGTKYRCRNRGTKFGVEGTCKYKYDECDGERYEGRRFCRSQECSCCVQDCGEPQPACEEAGGKCQHRTDPCDGKLNVGKQYCLNTIKCGCCGPIDCPEETLPACEALNGKCISQDEVCDGREVTHEAFCNYTNTCKCCFPKEPCVEQPCYPLECEYKELLGRCSRYEISGSYNAGQQQCTDGCYCYVTTGERPCYPLECEFKELLGQCSRDEILGTYNAGQRQCSDGCYCYVNPDERPCYPLECEFKELLGQCSRDEILGSYNAGQRQCSDDCYCYVNQGERPCYPLECEFQGLLGRCSRDDIQGSQNVGQQQCRDDCDCYVTTDCENERTCDRPEVAADGYYTTGQCRKNCHSNEYPYGQCDTYNQECNCCLIKNVELPCNPLECEFQRLLGRCSRDDIQGSQNVGQQQCRDGCDCYVTTDCENERTCDRPEAASEGYYTTGQCRKNCHSNEYPYGQCDIYNQECNCCLIKN